MDIRHEDFLFNLCKSSETLMTSPIVIDAMDKLQAKKLYEHLLEQRAWYRNLHQTERERLMVRNTPELRHAYAAMARLSAFEQVVTLQPIN